MAAFYTEQQRIDVREGHKRRVESGLFPCKAPYGYRNRRVDGRGLIEINKEQAEKVRSIFELYAHRNHTLDSLIEQLARACIACTPAAPRWTRSKIHAILRDRAYIGDIRYGGQWLPGSHPPIVDRHLFDRVQVLLGGRVYHSHDLVFASQQITCGHCGSPITGENIVKKATGKRYVYYRCSRYTSKGHPRVRLAERKLDAQVMALFESIKVSNNVRDWFTRMLHLWAQEHQNASRKKADAHQAELSRLREQQDRLLNLRLLEEIDADTFARKNTEWRDRIANLNLQLEAIQRGRDEQADLALKVLELSQSLQEKWLTAECDAKRQILDLLCLNLTLDGVTLVPTLRKPFDELVEGLDLAKNRGDRI